MDVETRLIRRGQPGKVLICDKHGKWVWVEPQKLASPLSYVLCTSVSFIIGTLLGVLALCAITVALADDLPANLTCRQARYIALSVGESTTWNRDRARAVAASYGYMMTEAQLDELSKCFDERGMNRASKKNKGE